MALIFRGMKNILIKDRKNILMVLHEEKIPLYLHPLWEKTRRRLGGRAGLKKKIYFFRPGVGGVKKTITFAARFERNGGKSLDRNGSRPAGRHYIPEVL
jgi:hypothetical protein